MTDSGNNPILLDLFRSAVSSIDVPNVEHFVDDDDLLLAWEQGELSESQLAELRAHMADCAYCRQAVAAMQETETLILPQADTASDDMPVVPAAEQPATPGRRSNRSVWGVVAVAALALVAIAVWPDAQNSPSQLVEVEQKLNSGDAHAAMRLAEQFLDKRQDFDEQSVARAVNLFQQAAYAVATDALKERRYSDVIDIESQVAARIGATGRLLNLKLQAELGMPGELSLAQNESLLGYGYDLDGYSRLMSLPDFDARYERMSRELSEAVTLHSGNAALRLNYGHFLLTYRQLDNAREEFQAVLDINDGNSLAHVGLGLVAYELQEFEDALTEFETALKSEPDNASTLVNAALCLTRLKRTEEARDYLDRAASTTTDANLQKQLSDWLKKLE